MMAFDGLIAPLARRTTCDFELAPGLSPVPPEDSRGGGHKPWIDVAEDASSRALEVARRLCNRAAAEDERQMPAKSVRRSAGVKGLRLEQAFYQFWVRASGAERARD